MFIFRTLVFILLLTFSAPSLAENPGCLSNEPVSIIIRNDDVCALSDPLWESRILKLFTDRGMSQSVGFVPLITTDVHYNPEAEFYSIDQTKEILDIYLPLIESGMIDPAQHGNTHQSNHLHAGNLPPSQSSEFNGLSVKEQSSKLQQGRGLLEKHLHHPIHIFIPPWNNLDNNTITALRQLKFKGVSDTLLYRTDGLKIAMPPSRMIEFKQLPEVLNQWQEEGQCKGNLAPQTVVILYHTWSEYSEEGLIRMANSLDLIQESGVKVQTLSQAFKITRHVK